MVKFRKLIELGYLNKASGTGIWKDYKWQNKGVCHPHVHMWSRSICSCLMDNKIPAQNNPSPGLGETTSSPPSPFVLDHPIWGGRALNLKGYFIYHRRCCGMDGRGLRRGALVNACKAGGLLGMQGHQWCIRCPKGSRGKGPRGEGLPPSSSM